MPYPPFSLESTQFDQTTWWGRTQHFFSITNPLYLFASDAQLTDAKAKLQAFRDGNRGAVTDAELWRARTLTDAVLHPDTSVPVPAMFRVCAFAPANIPICAGMLMTPPTTFNVVFWQWVNQTYNAGFNYSNRCDRISSVRSCCTAHAEATRATSLAQVPCFFLAETQADR